MRRVSLYNGISIYDYGKGEIEEQIARIMAACGLDGIFYPRVSLVGI